MYACTALVSSRLQKTTSPKKITISSATTIKHHKQHDIYDKRLDILEYYKDNYCVSNDRYAGNYIAIDTRQILYSVFGENVDREGYLILTASTTNNFFKQIWNDGKTLETLEPVQIDEMTYIYNYDSIDIDNKIYPPTVEKLRVVYPQMFNNYRKLTSTEDINSLDKNKKHHLIFGIDAIMKIKEQKMKEKN